MFNIVDTDKSAPKSGGLIWVHTVASTLILINDVANKCSRRLKQTSFSDALLQAL